MPGKSREGSQSVDRAASVVARQLRRRIVRGELTEGDVLPSEAILLEQFGVSRPTLREAVRVLESESLVVVKRGLRGGIEVSVPRVQTAAHYAGLILQYRHATTSDIFAAAASIEGPCLAMLARSRTAADIKELRKAVADERNAIPGSTDLLERQNDFHRMVVDLAGNRTLSVLSEVLSHIIEVATRRYVTETSETPTERDLVSKAGTRAHHKVVDLIEEKDAVGAEALWRKHIVATSVRLREAGIADSVVDLLE